MGFLNKKKAVDSVENKKNWYADRYQSVVVQRNFLAVLSLAALAGIMFSVLTVMQISRSKNIEPFVIEIEEKTGITNVIRPLLKEQFAYDEVLRRYFINKYVVSRETYDAASFDYNYFTVVRLLSAGDVYAGFLKTVRADDPDSPLRYGANRNLNIKVKSITFIPTSGEAEGFTAQVRFMKFVDNDVSKAAHKVATLGFDYYDLSLTQGERDVNPLGFRVTSYRVDDETI